MKLGSYLIAGIIAVSGTSGCGRSPTPKAKVTQATIIASVNRSLQSDGFPLQEGDSCDVLVADINRIGVRCIGNGTIAPVISVPNNMNIPSRYGVEQVIVVNGTLDPNSGHLFEYTKSSGQSI